MNTEPTSASCLFTSSNAFSSQKSGVESYTLFKLSMPKRKINCYVKLSYSNMQVYLCSNLAVNMLKPSLLEGKFLQIVTIPRRHIIVAKKIILMTAALL